MKDNKTVVLVLHGMSHGSKSGFIQKIVSAAKRAGHPVLAIDFPYISRGQTTASQDLVEEVQAIAQAVNTLATQYNQPIHIVAKSLGAIAASLYLSQQPDSRVVKITILGAVLKHLKLDGLKAYLTDVIQGQNDPNGSTDDVKKTFLSHGVTLHKLVEIKGGDHSYRDGSGQPVYEDQAVAAIEF